MIVNYFINGNLVLGGHAEVCIIVILIWDVLHNRGMTSLVLFHRKTTLSLRNL